MREVSPLKLKLGHRISKQWVRTCLFDAIEYVRILTFSISVKAGILLLSFLNAIKIEYSTEAIK